MTDEEIVNLYFKRNESAITEMQNRYYTYGDYYEGEQEKGCFTMGVKLVVTE